MGKYLPTIPDYSRKTWVKLPSLLIPWEMIEPHEAQCKLNHMQPLEKIRIRGGLAPSEALAVLDNRPWRRMDQDEAYAELQRRITAFAAQKAAAQTAIEEPKNDQPN